MADFSLRRLSPASWIMLALLLSLNLVVFFFALTGKDPEPVRTEGRLPAQTDPVKLLGELSDADRQMLTAPADRSEESGSALPEDQPVLACRAWGPFAGDDAMEPARSELAAVTDQLRVVSAQVAAPPDFLVYLDTDNNLDNARRLQQELEGQGIDAYVLAGGEFVNSVSAGVFSQDDSAARLMLRLEDLGYTPHLETLERFQEVMYLIARVPEDFALVDMLALPCTDIASPDEFL